MSQDMCTPSGAEIHVPGDTISVDLRCPRTHCLNLSRLPVIPFPLSRGPAHSLSLCRRTQKLIQPARSRWMPAWFSTRPFTAARTNATSFRCEQNTSLHSANISLIFVTQNTTAWTVAYKDALVSLSSRSSTDVIA